MKCPVCNNDLIIKDLDGEKFFLCTDCKKVYKPSDLMNIQNISANGENEDPRMALSICSMVLGIIGLLLSCIWIGIFPAVIGLIIAIIALATHRSKGMAIAGLVTSLIGIMIAAAILITNTTIDSILKEKGLTTSDGSKKEAVEDPSAQEEQTPTPEPEQPADDNMIDLNTGDYIIKYTGHAVGTDYDGNPCLLVYYDFTNNSDENTNAFSSSDVRIFQNGVRCESAYFSQENEAIDHYSTDIQPGVTINVAQAFSISDMSDVTIEASEYLSFDDTKDTMIVQLQ